MSTIYKDQLACEYLLVSIDTLKTTGLSASLVTSIHDNASTYKTKVVGRVWISPGTLESSEHEIKERFPAVRKLQATGVMSRVPMPTNGDTWTQDIL